MITVATDGSCIGNPGPAAWAWFVNDNAWHSGSLGRSTNNVGELTAILMAALELPADADVECLADSQYAIKALTRGPDGWLSGWERSGKLHDDTRLSNGPLIRAAVNTIDQRSGSWTFRWVKGHAGNPLNEAVDRLANTMAGRRGPSGISAGPRWPEDTRAGIVPVLAAGGTSPTPIEQAPSRAGRPFTMSARRDSDCFECGGRVKTGQKITRAGNGGWRHATCPPREPVATCGVCREQETVLGACNCP